MLGLGGQGMADVFISYARPDEAKARAIAHGLQRAGYQVWWDEQLPTHRAYYEVLEEKLRAASAVVVVWSKAAADSQWVRAEADLARSLQKLVQASADGGLPPMPFNQVQCAQLKSWRGADDHAEWVKLLDGVRALSGKPRAKRQPGQAPASHGMAGPQPRRYGRWLWGAGVAIGLLVAAAVALFVWQRPGAGAATADVRGRVAVLPFQASGGDSAATSFAADLAAEVSGDLSESALQTLPPDALAAPAGAERDSALQKAGVAFAVSGTVRSEDGRLHVRAFLEDVESKATVWSQEFEESADRVKVLRAAVGNSVVDTVWAALDASQQPGVRLDPQTLAIYIKGQFATATATSPFANSESRRASEEVIARAPKLGRGHSMLALDLAESIQAAPVAEREALRRRARREAEIGIRLAPHAASPSYDALFSLRRNEAPNDIAGAEDIIRKGVAAQPDYPFLWMRLCDVMLFAGRAHEALQYCGRANSVRSSAGPVAWRVGQSAYFVGDLGLAAKAFRSVVDRHPGYVNGRMRRFEFEALAGDPAEAVAMLDDPDQRPAGLSPSAMAAMRSFAEARKSKVDAGAAAAALQRAFAAGDLNSNSYVLFVSSLGRSAEAFATLDAMRPQEVTVLLLHPALAGLRRDPRFWREASRAGLITYWRARGLWPDFCAAPGFDCKAAAAMAQPA